MPTVQLSSNERRLRLFLGSKLPDGVAVSSGPPITKGIDIDVDVALTITIDLTKITIFVFSAWLAGKIHSALVKPGVYAHINDKDIPKDESDSIKLIAYEVTDDEHRQNPTG